MKKAILFLFLFPCFLIVNACKKEVVITPIIEEKTALLAIIPTIITAEESTIYKGTASEKIATIKVFLATEMIGSVVVQNKNWSFEYKHQKETINTALVFQGQDASGNVLATQTYTIQIKATNKAKIVQNMPYFYQYNNATNPGGSCQNTCVAMVLKYYAQKEGKNNIANDITPDAISATWGTSKAQSVAGMEDLFNKEANKKGLLVREKGTSTILLAEFRETAKLAEPLVVHGYFTNYGHIMVVLGFDGTYYTCNDPAGKWSQQYKNGGYSTTNNTEGIYIKYTKEAFEQAISPDGMVWMHSYK